MGLEGFGDLSYFLAQVLNLSLEIPQLPLGGSYLIAHCLGCNPQAIVDHHAQEEHHDHHESTNTEDDKGEAPIRVLLNLDLLPGWRS